VLLLLLSLAIQWQLNEPKCCSSKTTERMRWGKKPGMSRDSHKKVQTTSNTTEQDKSSPQEANKPSYPYGNQAAALSHSLTGC
jgi:hypothetical protein